MGKGPGILRSFQTSKEKRMMFTYTNHRKRPAKMACKEVGAYEVGGVGQGQGAINQSDHHTLIG